MIQRGASVPEAECVAALVAAGAENPPRGYGVRSPEEMESLDGRIVLPGGGGRSVFPHLLCEGSNAPERVEVL